MVEWTGGRIRCVSQLLACRWHHTTVLKSAHLLDMRQSSGANPTDSMLTHYGVKYTTIRLQCVGRIIRSNVDAEMKRLQFVG